MRSMSFGEVPDGWTFGDIAVCLADCVDGTLMDCVGVTMTGPIGAVVVKRSAHCLCDGEVPVDLDTLCCGTFCGCEDVLVDLM